jgi:hypothetical protein
VRTARLLRGCRVTARPARAVGDAIRGLPWVLRERHVVPADLEDGYRRLEHMQLDGGARTYVS